MTLKIYALIVLNVENYRKALYASKTNPHIRAFQMMMDRASGALDALWALDPTNTAWKETQWANQ